LTRLLRCTPGLGVQGRVGSASGQASPPHFWAFAMEEEKESLVIGSKIKRTSNEGADVLGD
jgi:hypothetical protein